jgi:hypothetical protein
MSSLGNTVNGVSMAVIGIGTDRDHPNNPFPLYETPPRNPGLVKAKNTYVFNMNG